MNAIDIKANEIFPGKVVRKDLTSQIKGNASVPTYVLEYLLGQYCATNDEATIEAGIETVRNIITKHFVHRDEANSIKSTIREQGSHRVIDKLSVRLNDRMDRYEANFANLGLSRVPIDDSFIKQHPKLLSEGVWSIITIGYMAGEEGKDLPWIIESVKPIQISRVFTDEYQLLRKDFSMEEWLDLLMQSIGLNPEEFTLRSKLLQLARLIPFTEKNYNLIELGPKGTGKSHIYSELSPHGILISGGEVSKAKLFVNNSNGEIGLVGYWDVVAYDEFAGKSKNTDRGLVDIMKNYMANKSFSRGTNVYQAEASMVFVGNTDHSVPYMLKHSDLFDALPKDYYDTAFLDRVHCYLPGWEVKKLRNEMFSSNYGFIVDYLAEVLKSLRKEDYTKAYQKYFKLSDSITTRDKTAIEKTFSGLVKVVFPHGEFDESQAKMMLEFAIESRKRVKDQLRKMDETFNDEIVNFSYFDSSGKEHFVETLEILEYGDAKLGILSQGVEIADKKENESKVKPQVSLAGFHKVIRDNQSNISYDCLFGDFLNGASEYIIRDPYIRLPYQMRNLMELCVLIAKKKEGDDEIRIHLVTNNNEDYIEGAKEAFQEIGESLSDLGIDFSYEFNETQHDRSIEMDNGWKIILGRGLDIWQKTNGRYDLAEYYQEKRLCKEFEITVLNY